MTVDQLHELINPFKPERRVFFARARDAKQPEGIIAIPWCNAHSWSHVDFDFYPADAWPEGEDVVIVIPYFD